MAAFSKKFRSLRLSFAFADAFTSVERCSAATLPVAVEEPDALVPVAAEEFVRAVVVSAYNAVHNDAAERTSAQRSAEGVNGFIASTWCPAYASEFRVLANPGENHRTLPRNG